jgi:hypothetical protein
MVHGDIDEMYVFWDNLHRSLVQHVHSTFVRIMRASEEGYTVSYIVAPGAVVGKSTGAVPTASIFFKFNTQISLAFKRAIYVGEGANVFYMVRASFPYYLSVSECSHRLCQVHLDDVVNFFRLLFAHVQSGKVAKASPYSRYYLVVANPVAWKDIASAVGAALKRHGKLEDERPKSISITELQSPCAFRVF